jgi:ADP-heptose:LPS heptosyltransferase
MDFSKSSRISIDKMRFIDRYAGIPLCLLFTIVHSFLKLIKKPKDIKNPEKILFIEMSEMGSLVLSYSLFRKTKELYPEASLYFLTFEETRDAVDVLDYFPKENIITIDSKNIYNFLFSSIRAIRKLRKEKIDIALDMELFARFTALLSYIIGAKNRIGYHRHSDEGLYRGNFLTHKVPFNPHIHIAYNMLNLICAANSPLDNIPLTKFPYDKRDIFIPQVKISSEEKEAVLRKLSKENTEVLEAKKLILINPNASDIIPIRRWPLERYVELIKLLLKLDGIYVVITGIKSEREEAARICQEVASNKCINFAGRTSFFELIELYHVADILITNDSGPVHFSSMTDIKTFVFFGPETPKLYGPLKKDTHVFYSNFSCSPCVSAFNHRKSPCNNNECLKAISVRSVYQEISKFLG